jgi:hypothetical protein
MYRPIPELYPNLISAKKRTVPVLGMTYFAPVTMATRPCKSSRSRSGEILDVALPMASTRGGKDAKTVPPVCRASRGFMNYDKYLEPSLFKTESIVFKSLSDQEPNLGPFMKTSQKRPHSKLQC